ncbi:hypothetical protein [Paucilactobacillus hokkaidonensis]|uniref:hypothetical protein n=1 Tax=Paucilactobacillus hokkaidonensis TaxID=1193095 RepID=UPI0006D02612|nr:hypothetical protein [Paucilactobacillus hokkaidonensis]
MTRSQKAFRNVLFFHRYLCSSINFIINCSSFFVRYIGREYLGLNSVYASILSVISIADLGLDTVFVYLLYKPLKTKDYSVINGILNLYKVIYRYITVVIVVVGIIIIPFIPSIIGKQVSLPGTYTIYFLYIMNAAVGYLNAYKRALFIADQNGYIVSGITSGFIVLVDILQIIQISIIPSSVIYMIIQVAGTFFLQTY